jgi:hypothetical protein
MPVSITGLAVRCDVYIPLWSRRGISGKDGSIKPAMVVFEGSDCFAAFPNFPMLWLGLSKTHGIDFICKYLGRDHTALENVQSW